MATRTGDSNTAKAIFRSADRFVRVDDAWYFETREGNRGPYSNRAAAEGGLTIFLERANPNADTAQKGPSHATPPTPAS